MDRKLIYGIVAIATVITASVLYLLFTNKTTKMDTPAVNERMMSDAPVASNTATPGAYVDYSQAAMQSAHSTKLLFFYAPWCPQCRQLDADIKKNGVPTDVTIFKVDYDSRQDLRMQYGVTIQTTIVRVSNDGTLVKKYVAHDQPTLAAVIKNLLP